MKSLTSGLLGYFSYDLKDQIEKLPRTSFDDLLLPDMYLVLPAKIIVHNIQEEESMIHAIQIEEADPAGILKEVKEIQSIAGIPADKNTNTARLTQLESNFSRADYIRAVHKIREYIKAGDVYQVNLSQLFTADISGSPFSLFS